VRDHAAHRKLKKDQFIIGVEFVPSGVVQITHLQQKEAMPI